MKNKSMAQRMSRRLDTPSLPDRCVIAVPSQSIEVTAIFQSWIYDETEEEITGDPRGNQHHNTASNQGIIEALRR